MKVLILLPGKDFDPTEVAVPWEILRAGCDVYFATPDGVKSVVDERMLTGQGLGIFAPLLIAARPAREVFRRLVGCESFLRPFSYDQALDESFDALVLPGGHASGMKDYLESPKVQSIAAAFMQANKPVAAICHGVLVLARTLVNQKAIIYDRKVTTLLKSGELLAWNLTKSKLGNYYRTYPETTVEDEVKAALRDPSQFSAGPPLVVRDSLSRLWAGHVVKDGNLITARWPGDAHKFALTLKEALA